MGAEVVALSPAQHDTLVAVVSHVPHLTAATLMNLADRASEEHAALLRLAAGGFRDMTTRRRRSAGHLARRVRRELRGHRLHLGRIAGRSGHDARPCRDRGPHGTARSPRACRHARRSLPARAVRPERLAEMRVPVPDRPGVLAEITTLAGDLGVNIADLEIAHSAEGDRGVLVLVVNTDEADRLARALSERGFRSTSGRLS